MPPFSNLVPTEDLDHYVQCETRSSSSFPAIVTWKTTIFLPAVMDSAVDTAAFFASLNTAFVTSGRILTTLEGRRRHVYFPAQVP